MLGEGPTDRFSDTYRQSVLPSTETKKGQPHRGAGVYTLKVLIIICVQYLMVTTFALPSLDNIQLRLSSYQGVAPTIDTCGSISALQSNT